jgi:hypothetical protein
MRISMKWKATLSTAVAGIGLLAMFFSFKAWKSLRQPIPPLEFPKQEIPDIPGSFSPRNVPALDDVRLLDGDFKIVRRVNEIPANCLLTFESSFVTINGVRAKPGDVPLANPGEPFQWSDSIPEDHPPFRRLEFAGLGAAQCFIHYQSGGQPSSFCLAVIENANQKIRVGEYWKRAKDLDELRRMLHRRQFHDGRGC